MFDTKSLNNYPDLQAAHTAAVEYFINVFGHSGAVILDTESFFTAQEQVVEFLSLDDETKVYACVVKDSKRAALPVVSWLPSFFN